MALIPPEPSPPATNEFAEQQQPMELVQIIEKSGLPEEQKIELLKSVFQFSSYYSGPLPPPEFLAEYNKIVPDAGRRILEMAEKEQQIRSNHQRIWSDIQTRILSNERLKIKGSIFWSIALIGIAGLATWMGNIPIAISLGLAGSILGIFRGVIEWLDNREAFKE